MRNINKNPLQNEIEVNEILEALKDLSFILNDIDSKPQTTKPKPPFRTSTLQMSAASSFGFTADRTMQAAQKLYEGGLITYLRTDGISISTSPNTGEPFSEENPGPPPLQEIRNFISSNYDSSFLSKETRIYESKVQNSQEAHEAIRPAGTSMATAAELGLNGPEAKLYDQARALEKKGRISEAIRCLEAGIQLNNQLPSFFNQLGIIYAVHRKDFKKAQDYLRKAIALDQNNVHYKSNLDKVQFEEEFLPILSI